MQLKPRLFFDIDGTLAEYKFEGIEAYYDKGFFLELKPHEKVIKLAQEIISNHKEIEVFTLSAVYTDSRYSVRDKNDWLDRNLPEIDMEHRIFTPCGQNKTDYLPGGLMPLDVLIDDFSPNLFKWRGFAAIKMRNGINGTKNTWKGYSIDKDADVSTNVAYILNVFKAYQENL